MKHLTIKELLASTMCFYPRDTLADFQRLKSSTEEYSLFNQGWALAQEFSEDSLGVPTSDLSCTVIATIDTLEAFSKEDLSTYKVGTKYTSLPIKTKNGLKHERIDVSILNPKNKFLEEYSITIYFPFATFKHLCDLVGCSIYANLYSTVSELLPLPEVTPTLTHMRKSLGKPWIEDTEDTIFDTMLTPRIAIADIGDLLTQLGYKEYVPESSITLQ